jgi:hypothetical protein
MKTRRWAGWVVLLWAAGVSGSAGAATLLALDLGQLVKQSELVVVAKAEARRSRQTPADGMIVTDVTLRVLTSLKGQSKPGTTLTATVLGGSVGDLGLRVPGEATFPDNRSAIVFLRREASSGELAVTGMSQGVMAIHGNGQAAQVMPGGLEAELVQRDAEGALRAAPDALVRARPLLDVIREIERLVREQR